MKVLINDFEIMGTVFRFTFSPTDEELVLQLLPLAQQLLIEADQTFSTYKPDSEISKIRAGDLTIEQASLDVRQIRQGCEYWFNQTNGAFNALDPAGQWDPSGLVKGWAAQAVVNFLVANGVRNFTLNAGGDVLIGPEVTGVLERVGVAMPISIAKTGLRAGWLLDLSNSDYRAVATSGIAERGSHIWGTGQDLVQVTVVAKDLITADVWATALFAANFDARSAFADADAEALFVFADGSEQRTDGFSQFEVELNLTKEG